MTVPELQALIASLESEATFLQTQKEVLRDEFFDAKEHFVSAENSYNCILAKIDEAKAYKTRALETLVSKLTNAVK